jgi:hypothetical protein
MQSQIRGHIVVKESEYVLDECAPSHIGENDVVGEVLGWDNTPEDIFVEQNPWVQWDRRRFFVILNVLGVGLVVILLIPLNVVGSLHNIHELTKAQRAYRLLH